MRGRLITLEGIDGTGKSAVAARLRQSLPRSERSAGRDFVFTAEPTDGDAGRLLRKLLRRPDAAGERLWQLEDLFLFMADHADHLATTVIPALDRGNVVISDRYSDSRVAYQGATLRGVVPNAMEWVRDLHRPWSADPDLTLLFTIDPALAVKRCRQRGNGPEGTSMEKFEREEFLREVEKNFLCLAKREPERFVMIDASRGLEEVAKEALKAITDHLSRCGQDRS